MSADRQRSYDVYCAKSSGREKLFATYTSISEAQAAALRLSGLGCRSRVSPAPDRKAVLIHAEAPAGIHK